MYIVLVDNEIVGIYKNAWNAIRDILGNAEDGANITLCGNGNTYTIIYKDTMD